MEFLKVLHPVVLTAWAGLLVLYLFWPYALLFGEYHGPLGSNDPKSIGLTETYLFLKYTIGIGLLFCSLLILLLLVITLVTGGRRSVSTWAWRGGIGIILLQLALRIFDPWGYLSWFFD